MKSLLILVLVLALAVAAFMTRPPTTDFANYLHSQQQSSGLSLKGIFSGMQIDNYLRSVTYHDRLLWISVQKDGQTQYIGAFSHWFKTKAAQPAG